MLYRLSCFIFSLGVFAPGNVCDAQNLDLDSLYFAQADIKFDELQASFEKNDVDTINTEARLIIKSMIYLYNEIYQSPPHFSENQMTMETVAGYIGHLGETASSIHIYNLLLTTKEPKGTDSEKDDKTTFYSYSYYMNLSCIALAEHYIKLQDYTAALHYAKKSNKHPIWFMCGNGAQAYRNDKAVLFAKIYLGIGKSDKALSELLPYVISSGLADHSEVITLALHIIKENYSASEIRMELALAMSEIKIKDNAGRDIVYTKLFGERIRLYPRFGFSRPLNSDPTDSNAGEKKSMTTLERYTLAFNEAEFIQKLYVLSSLE